MRGSKIFLYFNSFVCFTQYEYAANWRCVTNCYWIIQVLAIYLFFSEIDMSTFWNSNNEMPVSQQPLSDREVESKFYKIFLRKYWIFLRTQQAIASNFYYWLAVYKFHTFPCFIRSWFPDRCWKLTHSTKHWITWWWVEQSNVLKFHFQRNIVNFNFCNMCVEVVDGFFYVWLGLTRSVNIIWE